MEHRLLGTTGLRVSELCFGTMSFGDMADENTSAALYRRAREAGIDFFDCANVYSAGRAEEILGRLAAGERNREIVFVHTLDPATPIEETLRALDLVVRQGKVLHIGVSNWAAWQIATALGASHRESLAAFSCVQPMYSLVKRQAEVEILPLCRAAGLGVITYSPLGGGLLSGKYGADRRPERGRLVENRMYAARYGDDVYFDVADTFTALARELDVHPATLAVAWVKAHPAMTAPILGARNVEQLEPALAAAEFPMTQELYARVASLAPTPPPATDRTEEQRGVAYGGSSEKYK
ncbi:MAG: aldo/keto reductase [Candidatus Bipolaricaulota bacterium]|nr:aldo/keto reductase [Candidatus Bipolaricaulota bacterium]